MIKQLVEDEVLGLRWTPTWKQLADPLTKEMSGSLLQSFRRKPVLCLIQTPEDEKEEVRRSNLRKAQRERRKARMKTGWWDESTLFPSDVQRAVFAWFLTHRQVRTNREVQEIEKCNFASPNPAAFLTLKTSMFIQQQKTAFANFACLHCCVSLHRGSLLGKPPFLGIFCWEWCPIHRFIPLFIGFLLVAKDFVTIHRNCLDGTNAKNMVTGQPLGHSKALKIKPFLWE